MPVDPTALHDPTFIPSSKRTYPRCNAVVAPGVRCERIAHPDGPHFALFEDKATVIWHIDTSTDWASDDDGDIRGGL